MPHLRLSAARVALAAIAVCASPVVPASAASRPHLRLSYASSDIEVGQPVVFSYRASHLARGERIEFQRPVGTAGHWHKVRRLHAHAGIVQAPSAAQGVRRFRVAVLDRRGHIRATATRSLRVYAPVPLATVADTSTDTVAVGGNLFRYLSGYALALDGGDECLFFRTCNAGDLLTALSLDHSSCRSLSMDFAALDNTGSATPVLVTVVSEAADPSSVSVPVNGVASLMAVVRGDAQVQYAVQPAADDDAGLYLNGTADCYTASGSTQSAS